MWFVIELLKSQYHISIRLRDTLKIRIFDITLCWDEIWHSDFHRNASNHLSNKLMIRPEIFVQNFDMMILNSKFYSSLVDQDKIFRVSKWCCKSNFINTQTYFRQFYDILDIYDGGHCLHSTPDLSCIVLAIL